MVKVVDKDDSLYNQITSNLFRTKTIPPLTLAYSTIVLVRHSADRVTKAG